MGNGSNDGYFETGSGHNNINSQNNQTGDFEQNNTSFSQGNTGFGQNGQYQNNQYNSFDPLLAQKFTARYMIWLILGIAQSLSLCCCNWFGVLTGIATIVLVLKAKKEFNRGNLYKSVSNLKIAGIINIIGWVILVVVSILNLIFGTFQVLFSPIN